MYQDFTVSYLLINSKLKTYSFQKADEKYDFIITTLNTNIMGFFREIFNMAKNFLKLLYNNYKNVKSYSVVFTWT